jgi:serine-type D-Ala-D-Ala carboxypeptidase/endopeptidase
MKSTHFVAVVTVVMVVWCTAASSAEDRTIRGLPDEDEVAAYVQPLIDDESYVGIVIGVVGPDGRRVFSFGRIDRDQGQKPSGDTVFALASITKTFTGVLLADLALRGVVKLDDPVTKFLPPGAINRESPLSRVTLLDLATHMSGLPKMPTNAAPDGGPVTQRPYSVEQMYAFLSRYRPARPPGTDFQYSNIGVALLGHILERADGVPYERLVEDLICRPLKMTSTRITPNAAMRRRLAQGYNRFLDPVPLRRFDAGKSSGGLLSTANDMMNFLAANMGIFEAPIVPTLMEAQQPVRKVPGKEGAFMGLTWHVRKAGGREIVSKNGGVRGFQSFIAFDKTGRIGIIALANTSPEGRKLDAAARRILMKALSHRQP